MISKSKHLSVQEGDYVEIGDVLVDGSAVPHDILRIKGVEALSEYLIKEVQDVYRLQGVKINDKHIEVIIRQMMQKVEITDPGETTLLVGEQISKTELNQINANAKNQKQKEATGTPLLLGITKLLFKLIVLFLQHHFKKPPEFLLKHLFREKLTV